MGRRLCNQRETAKQERSVARRKWFIVALDRADTQKNLARSPARRHILPEPADDQVGDLQVVLVHHQHVAVALVAGLGQQQELGRAAATEVIE